MKKEGSVSVITRKFTYVLMDEKEPNNVGRAFLNRYIKG